MYRDSKRLRRWVAAVSSVLVVYGFVSGWGDVYDSWARATTFLLAKVGLPPIPDPYRVPSLLVFLVAFALLLRPILRLAGEVPERKEARDRGISLHTLRRERARRAYLDLLTDEVENRLRSSIHRARFLDLGLEEERGATLPWHYVSDIGPAMPRSFASLDEAFEAFRGRFLLLGGPGSGKTTSLLHLALQLLTRAKVDSTAPVPVLLNLSTYPHIRRPPGWRSFLRPAAPSEAGGDLEAWLQWELSRLHLPGPGLVTEWVEEGNLALLLDGLDEIQREDRASVVQALNRAAQAAFPVLPLVVCSRLTDYESLVDDEGVRLKLPGAVTLQPLDRPQVELYLAAARAGSLRDALARDPGLYELAKTPLTLSMMTLAYTGPAPVDLGEDFPLVERRRRLFDHYIDQMMQRLARRKAGKTFDLNPALDEPTHYSRREVDRYLGWLAVRMSERSRSSFRPDELASFLALNPAVTATLEVPAEASWIRFLRSERLLAELLVTVAAALGLIAALMSLAAPPLQPWEAPIAFIAGLGATVWARALIGRLRRVDRARPAGFVRTFRWSLPVLLLYVATAFAFLHLAVAQILSTRSAFVAFGFLLATHQLIKIFAREEPRKVTSLRILCAGPAGAAAVVAAMESRYGALPWIYSSFGFLCLGLPVLLKFRERRLPVHVAKILLLIVLLGLVQVLLVSFTAFPLAAAIPLITFTFGLASAFGIATGLALAVGSIGGALALGAPGSLLGAVLFLYVFSAFASERFRDWVENRLVGPGMRLVLAWRGETPIAFTNFLAYCSEALLLKRSGGDFEFVHRLLRDHFALRELTPRLHDEDGTARLELVAQLANLGESSFETLSELISHPSVEVRRAAVQGLGALTTPERAPLLERVLSADGSVAVRSQAVEGLARLPLEAACNGLNLAFDDAAADVRATAARALGSMGIAHSFDGIKLAEQLREALRDPADVVLRSSIRALGDDMSLWPVMSLAENFTDEQLSRVISQARELLRQGDSQEMSAAVRVLGSIQDTESLTTLLNLTEASDELVRSAAVSALGELGQLEAVAQLLKLLKNGSLLDRRAAAPALGQLLLKRHEGQNASSFPIGAVEAGLVEALDSLSSDVALAAAKSLRHIATPCAAKALVRSLKRFNEAGQKVVLDSLLSMAAEVEPKTLLSLLEYSQARVRYSAAKLFPHHPSLEPALLGLLKTGSRRQRTGSALALGYLGSLEAIPYLVMMLEHGHPKTRYGTLIRHPAMKAEVLRLFRDGTPPERIGAALMLSILRSRAAMRIVVIVADAPSYLLDLVREVLGKEPLSMALAAHLALILIGDKAVPHLAEALATGTPVQRLAAAGTLAEIPTSTSTRALRKSLKSLDPEWRQTVRTALEHQKKRSSIPEGLLRYIRTGNTIERALNAKS